MQSERRFKNFNFKVGTFIFEYCIWNWKQLPGFFLSACVRVCVCSWFISLGIIIRRIIHVVECVNSSLLITAELIPLYGHSSICLSIHPLIHIWVVLVWDCYKQSCYLQDFLWAYTVISLKLNI